MDRETARNLVAGYGLKSEPVATPSWPDLDGKISVRELTGTEQIDYENSDQGRDATGKILVKTILLTESKTPLFNDADFQWVMDTFGMSALRPMFLKAMELSKVLKSQQATVVDDAKKN
jgi:hypothetical protein